MKNLLCFICCTVLFIACTKGDDTMPPPELKEIDKLPPATQTGANKVGCLVNGKAFLPQGSNPAGGNPNPYCGYYHDAFVLGMTIFRHENNITMEGSEGVFVYSNNVILEEGSTYILKEDVNSHSAKYSVYSMSNPQSYETNANNSGELHIIKLDKTNNIISGTFWFDAVNQQGKKVEIREGRFDMTFEGWTG